VPRRVSLVAAVFAISALAVPAAASAADTGGHSSDAVVVISGDVTVPRGETVDGVFIAHGDARIAGRVDGDVVVFSGDVVVSGTIDGDLFTASGQARLLRTAEVTGDVDYGSDRAQVALDARVHGDIQKKGWPDLGGLLPVIGGLLVWLAVGISNLLLGALLLLIAPRAADDLDRRSRDRVGPVIAIGIAILIVLPVAAVIAGITVVGLPLALGILLALLPIAAVAYTVSAWVLGRRIVKPPRKRFLSLLVGVAILWALSLIPIVGFLVGLTAVVFGLGLIGSSIGAARTPPGEAPSTPAPAQSPGS
jgi:cytoskeletal protein CcmA (bactofilin family)